MAIAFRASSSYTDNAAGNTITINKPSGTVAGDFMVASAALCGDINPAPPITGWNVESWQIAGVGSGVAMTHVIYSRVCQSGDGSSWTSSTFSTTGDGTDRLVECCSYSGVDNGNPIDFSRGNQNNSGTTMVAGTSVNVYVNGWVVAAFGGRSATASAGTWTCSGSLTERIDTGTVASSKAVSGAMYDSNGAAALGALSYTGTSTASFSQGAGGWSGILTPAGESPSPYPVRIGNQTANSTATNGHLTISYPDGSVAGDLVVLAFNSGRSTSSAYTVSSIDGPSWTLLESLNATAANGLRWDIYWAIRGPETSVSITHSVSSSFRGVFGRTVAYAQDTIDTTNPIDTSAINAAVTSGSATAPTITTGFNNVEVLGVAFAWRSGTGTNFTATWNNSFTEIADESTASNSSYRVNLNSATRQFPTASTATGNCTITWSPSSSIVARGGAQVSIKPPQNQTKTDSDTSGTTADSGKVSATTPASDTSGATVDVVSKIVVAPTLSETGAASDTAKVAATLASADTSTSVDLAAGVTAYITQSDTGTATDSAGVTVAAPPANDVAAGADSATVLVKAASDSGHGTDSQVGFGSDTATGVDVAGSVIVGGAADTGSAADIGASSTAAIVADTAGSVDSATVIVSVTDSGSGNDAQTGFGFDYGTGTDTTKLVAVTPNTDTGTGADTAASSNLATSIDSFGVTVDSASVRFAVFDNAGAAVDLAVLSANLPVTETGSFTESTATLRLPVSDSSSPTVDSATIRFGVTEVGSFTDNAKIAVSVFASDTCSAVDVSGILVTSADYSSGVLEVAFHTADGKLIADRVTYIDVETRTTEVVSESRLCTVDGEDRYMLFDADSRTCAVDSEDRYVTIGLESL